MAGRKFDLSGEFDVKQKNEPVVAKEEPKVEKDTVIGAASGTEVVTPVGLDSTRGRKGQKLPTMNMRFTPENYEYMKREGAVRGMTATKFVNWLIESYRSNPAHVHYDDSFKDTEGWDD